MSWHYLQEEVAGFSLQNYLDSIPYAQLKSEMTRDNVYCKDSETELSINSQYGMTFQHLTVNHGEERSTSSQEDSRAKTLARQGKALELLEIGAAFGKSIRESLAKLDLDLSSRKTLHYFDLADLQSSLETFPRWGMTLDGVCLELGTSAKFTREIECGFLPTPSGVNGGRNQNHISGRLDEWGGSSNPFRKTEIGNVHCPRFEEWMMGWPETWAALTGFEMDKYQLWLQQHSDYFLVD